MSNPLDKIVPRLSIPAYLVTWGEEDTGDEVYLDRYLAERHAKAMWNGKVQHVRIFLDGLSGFGQMAEEHRKEGSR